MIDRRFLIGSALAALVGTAVRAEAPASSLVPKPRPGQSAKGTAAPSQAEALVGAAKLGGTTSYLLVDFDSGEVLAERLADQMMAPASVTKALTTIYALDRLGPDFRFVTKLLRSSRGVVLQGGGDPMLNTDGLETLAKRARAAGLTRADSYFYDDSDLPRLREIEDDQLPYLNYNPSVSGLNLNFNNVHFEWKKAGKDFSVTMEARTDRLRPAVRLSRMEIENRDVPVYSYSENGSREYWSVARGALGNGGSRWLPVRHPGAYAAEVFATLAAAEGISLPEGERGRAEGTLLAKVDSPPLTEIARVMNDLSVNLVAEVLGLRASGASEIATSARAMAQHLVAYGAKTARFGGHSGLSADTRISAHEMVEVLRQAEPRHRLSELLKTVPVRNSKGKIIKDHPMRVQAKTGTLNFVSTLAGYASVGKRRLAFAIFSGDLERRAEAARAKEELPEGVSGWTKRARQLQSSLLDDWARQLG